MTIIKDNSLDTSAALLSDIAENVLDRTKYTYSAGRESICIYSGHYSSHKLLEIFNSTCSYKLEELKNSIEIADLYATVLLEDKYQELAREHNEKYKDVQYPPPMFLFSEPPRRASPLIYQYFYSEAEWFQKMTVHDNILPYESTWNINTIRNKIIEDISFFCGGFASREEYESSYER
jgi:hypothetical protein